MIDFFERKLLGQHGIEFEEAAEVARWEALSFYLTLLAGRRSVSFSYPSSLDNGELMPNSFFDRLGLTPLKAPPDTKIVSSVKERRMVVLRTQESPSDDMVLAPARVQYAVELNRENSPHYDEYDGVIGVPFEPGDRRWSASQLTAIGQCGFRWFAQRVLKLEPVEEIELGMDYTKRGTFYHKVLELAVSRAMAEGDIRAATLQHLDAAFAEAEKSPDAAVPTLLNWDLQRAEHIGALRKAVESVEFISDGARVIGLEQMFEETWNGFRLIGYIDRVDETPDGLIAIDYKTSSVPPKGAKDEAGKLTVDVQIPLYSNVALKKLYPAGTLGNSVYYSLVKGKVLRAEKEDDFVKLDGLVNRIKKTLADGNFAVDPDADEYACTYCKFDQVCRKGLRLERKTANT
ncbi:MAG: PD-(D/E)XK nuclease family protein [Acidobacteria bacterium]|nr:PD-(D/E)XK nuclease family protein [Acidobacteriota bacterium]